MASCLATVSVQMNEWKIDFVAVESAVPYSRRFEKWWELESYNIVVVNVLAYNMS